MKYSCLSKWQFLLYFYTPRKHSLGGYIGICLSVLSVCLSGPTSTSFVWFPPNFVEFKIMMFELCSIKDFIVHWVLPLLCFFGLRNFETIQYALCHRNFSYMINQKFMKLCTLQCKTPASSSTSIFFYVIFVLMGRLIFWYNSGIDKIKLSIFYPVLMP